MTDEELRERIAALEHEQWAHWTRYLLDVLAPLINDAMGEDYRAAAARAEAGEGWGVFPPWLQALHCWERQIKTPYVRLSESEKDSDREWADKVLALIQRAEGREVSDE